MQGHQRFAFAETQAPLVSAAFIPQQLPAIILSPVCGALYYFIQFSAGKY